jgi:type I restriction enzyme S subunit
MNAWPVKTLGEVCEVLDSLRKPITKRDRTAGGYPYYGATGIVDHVGDYIFDERLVLVGEDGAKWDAGDRTAFIAEGKYWVNNHAHVLRCKPGVLVDSWLASFLTMSDLNSYVSGLTVPKLNQGSLVSIEIPVPPLEEQKRIVELLDAATARVTELTECHEQARTHANNLFISASREVFEGNPDWPVKTLGEVCEVLDSLRKPITKRDRTAGGYPYYGATGIVDYVGDYIFDERLVLVGEDGAKWDSGDRTAFIVEGRYWVNNHAHVLRCKPGVLVDSWLANFLTMSDLNSYVSGLTVPKLNQGSLVSIEIPVPPFEEQKRIIAQLDSVKAKTSEMVAAYDAKLTAVKNLRQSILEAAFAGEL